MSFYDEMQSFARDILAPTSQGGLGQGQIILSRTIPGPPPTDPFEPPTTTTEEEVLRAAVSGVSKELIGVEAGGTVIVASDRQAICAVPAMSYTPGDRLVVDGVPVHIVTVINIPAAGVTSAVRFVIRG